MAGQMEQESTSGYLPAGATGFGARLLASFVASGAVVPTR
jgi:leucyl aminopeptidase